MFRMEVYPMTVIVTFSLFIFNILSCCIVNSATMCPDNSHCTPVSECKFGLDDVLYPCHSGEHVCCTNLVEKIERMPTTMKYEPFNTIIDEDIERFKTTTPKKIETNTVNEKLDKYSYDTKKPIQDIHDDKTSTSIKKTTETYDQIRFNAPDEDQEVLVKRSKFFKENCGLSTADNKITGGHVAELGQFPWMALLGFKHEAVQSIQYLCGGSLITDRHVLTAAHCIVENLPLKLIVVRLGEYNLTSNRDCIQFGKDNVCADRHVDVAVAYATIHSNYDRRSLKNDIAIIRLMHNVRESDYVRTVCLPFGKKFSKTNFTGQNFTVSGWGKSSSSNLFGSNVLQYAKVRVWDIDRCNKSVPPEVRPLTTSQLCANGPNSEDACKGDSGGPLINTTIDNDSEIRNFQYGIVSFGTATCGDSNLPTVYTRVDRYLQWIVENVT